MVIDPKLHFCTKCGNTFKPRLYHKLLMLIFKKYYWNCPECKSRMKFVLVHHVVKVESENLFDKEIWKNG